MPKTPPVSISVFQTIFLLDVFDLLISGDLASNYIKRHLFHARHHFLSAARDSRLGLIHDIILLKTTMHVKTAHPIIPNASSQPCTAPIKMKKPMTFIHFLITRSISFGI